MLHYTQWAMMNVGASLLVVVYPRVMRDSLRYQQQHPINGIAFGNTEREREGQRERARWPDRRCGCLLLLCESHFALDSSQTNWKFITPTYTIDDDFWCHSKWIFYTCHRVESVTKGRDRWQRWLWLRLWSAFNHSQIDFNCLKITDHNAKDNFCPAVLKSRAKSPFPPPPPCLTYHTITIVIHIHICTYLRLYHILAANLSNFKVNSHAKADISSTNAQSHWPDPQSGDIDAGSLTGNAPSEGGTKSTAEWADKKFELS